MRGRCVTGGSGGRVDDMAGSEGAGDHEREASARGQEADPRSRIRSGRLKMIALVLVLALPVIASYVTYYLVRPEGRTNYGTLLEQRAVGDLAAIDLQGNARSFDEFRGRWVMLVVGASDCDPACRERLYQVRQLRLTTGKDRERVERVWLIPDAGTPDAGLLAEHDGTVVLRATAGRIGAHFPATETTRAADHIWLIDPMGHLMMRFPRDADPSRIKKDLSRLLRASQIG